MIIVKGPVKDHKLYVWVASDFQYGSNECDKSKLLKYLKWADQTENLRIILDGDLMENCIPEHLPQAMFEQDKLPKTQLEELVDLLKPLRKKIVCAFTGNHELRTYFKTGFDPTEMLCLRLNIPYARYGGYVQVNAGTQSYLFAIHHGASGSTVNPDLDPNRLRNIYPGAEIFALGHNHFLGSRRKVCRDPDPTGKLPWIEREIVYVRTGSFQKYAGYAERKMLEPTRTGQAIIKLYSDIHKIGVDDSDKIGSGVLKK